MLRAGDRRLPEKGQAQQGQEEELIVATSGTAVNVEGIGSIADVEHGKGSFEKENFIVLLLRLIAPPIPLIKSAHIKLLLLNLHFYILKDAPTPLFH